MFLNRITKDAIIMANELLKLDLNDLSAENQNDTQTDDILAQKEDIIDNEIDASTNCLALTVKEDYHIVVFKNFFKKSARISWKIAISFLTMNFLNMFL